MRAPAPLAATVLALALAFPAAALPIGAPVPGALEPFDLVLVAAGAPARVEVAGLPACLPVPLGCDEVFVGAEAVRLLFKGRASGPDAWCGQAALQLNGVEATRLWRYSRSTGVHGCLTIGPDGAFAFAHRWLSFEGRADLAVQGSCLGAGALARLAEAGPASVHLVAWEDPVALQGAAAVLHRC